MNDLFNFVKEPNDKAQQELEKVKLEKLREKHRYEQQAFRENQRQFFLEKARFLQEPQKHGNLSECDITTLARNLKIKSQVSCELLNTIMNSLLVSKENITAFLKVDGALQALLRLLSGQNEKFQLIAAQCICNLALGDEKQSLHVCKASESYLMMHLSGRNHYVVEACATALGNLSRQNLNNVELLINQGFFSKIINLLNNEDLNIEAAAIYALTQLIYHGFDIVRSEDLESCLVAVLSIFQKRSFAVAFLVSILSSCKCFHSQLILNDVQTDALKYLVISLKEDEKETLYFLRIVSNLINEESGCAGKSLIENHSYTLRECVTYVLQSDKEYLKKECIGLIGNLVNCPVEMLREFGVDLVKENYELIKLYMTNSHSAQTENIIS